MRVKTLQELADAGKLSGKRVLIRSDLNAPHDESGRITDETRLTASVPAIQMALRAGAGDGGEPPRPPEGRRSDRS